MVKSTLIGFLSLLLLISGWLGYTLYEQSNTRASLKEDFAMVNGIEYGILSASSWKDRIINIIQYQIDDFDLTPRQDSLLREEVREILHKMIDEAEQQMQQTDDQKLKDRLRKIVVNVLVDWDKLRKQVPNFTETIVREVMSNESKERLKTLAMSKVDEYSEQIYDDSTAAVHKTMFSQYGVEDLEQFNMEVESRTNRIEEETFTRAYGLLGLGLLFLFPWLIIWRFRLDDLRKPLFTMSIGYALILLLTGISSPMIEIDARIAQVDFVLLGEHILFENQMLFYRSKSILEVIQVLIETKKADTLLVGVLIFIFSVVLPLSKLIATQVFLLGKRNIQKTWLVDWLVFHSGKWSMADVMVVAIFMSFIGFRGMLDSQLEIIDQQGQNLTSIATNLTSLQPGFLIFLAFVLFSLLLAQTLKSTIKDEEP